MSRTELLLGKFFGLSTLTVNVSVMTGALRPLPSTPP
jgi:hypothetical protein